jgi:hypothetical protein
MMLLVNDTNGTLATEEEENTRGFAYYSVCIVVFFITPLFSFNIFLMVSVFVEKGIPAAIRFILCNILAASDVVILGLGIFFMDIIILSAQHHLLQSEFVCRLIYTTLAVGCASRLLLMPTFAITVVILVRHGITKIRLLPTILVVGLLWLFTTLPNLVIFSPKIWVISFITGDQCSPHATGAITITYSFAYITVYGLCSLLITTVSTIFGVVYIKRNTISQNRSVLKNMIKFAVFLLLGNVISLVGTSIPLLIGTFAPIENRHTQMEEALNYIEGITLMCSLIPLPVLLLVFFKPIRMRFRRILCIACYKTKDKTISSTNTTMSTAGESNNV